jgi:hypothetical protein
MQIFSGFANQQLTRSVQRLDETPRPAAMNDGPTLASHRCVRAIVTDVPHSTDSALAGLGFVRGNDGVLLAPAVSRTTLAPVGNFYELRNSLGDGNAVVAVLSKSAVKITREGKP